MFYDNSQWVLCKKKKIWISAFNSRNKHIISWCIIFVVLFDIVFSVINRIDNLIPIHYFNYINTLIQRAIVHGHCNRFFLPPLLQKLDFNPCACMWCDNIRRYYCASIINIIVLAKWIARISQESRGIRRYTAKQWFSIGRRRHLTGRNFVFV